MRLLFVLCALWLSTPAQAGTLGLLGAGPGSRAVAPSYTGPGDVVASAVGWWGLRCYNTAYAGSVAQIFDAATGSTTQTLLTCSAGGTINETINSLATTCAVACVVATLYDQSGNAHDATQGSNSTRPTLVLNCIGSLSCMNFSGSQYLNVAPANATQPWTVSAVYNHTGAAAFTSVYGDGSGNGYGIVTGSSANQIITWAGSALTATATDSSPHAIQAIGNGGSSVAYVDGSATNGAAGANQLTGAGSAIGNGFGAYAGRIMEVGVWGSAFSGGNQSAMNSNQHTYWGF